MLLVQLIFCGSAVWIKSPLTTASRLSHFQEEFRSEFVISLNIRRLLPSGHATRRSLAAAHQTQESGLFLTTLGSTPEQASHVPPDQSRADVGTAALRARSFIQASDARNKRALASRIGRFPASANIGRTGLKKQNDGCKQSSEGVFPRTKALEQEGDCTESDCKSHNRLIRKNIGRKDIRRDQCSCHQHADAGPLHGFDADGCTLSFLEEIFVQPRTPDGFIQRLRPIRL